MESSPLKRCVWQISDGAIRSFGREESTLSGSYEMLDVVL
jgi:hypothetical protein